MHFAPDQRQDWEVTEAELMQFICGDIGYPPKQAHYGLRQNVSDIFKAVYGASVNVLVKLKLWCKSLSR